MTKPDQATRNQHRPVTCRIMVGTSGYSYAEWTTAGFYPPGTRSGDMLAVYARIFGVTELNYTWYQMPREETLDRMHRRVPEGFRFAAKLTRTLTHEIDAKQWRRQAGAYRAGIAPLLQGARLAAILIQFPPAFDRSIKNRSQLGAILDELSGLPLAVEFRHRSWAMDRVFTELESRRVTLVAVDEPELPGLFPKLDVVTNPDLFYIRFHGRNTRGWRSGSMQQQFDYDYTDMELEEWVEERIEAMAARSAAGVIFFNNHVRAQAPGNAQQLIRLMKHRKLNVCFPENAARIEKPCGKTTLSH